MSAPLKILVVANPADQAELVSALRSAGSPLTEARLVSGVGDDGTLARFVAEQPSVVIMGATLERGDSAALIDAMRERAAPSSIFVVLIGDPRGPVQNALDALDIGGDRFVGRPLTTKALRFAVVSGMGQATGPWGSESKAAISVQALAAAAMAPGAGDRRGVRLTPVPGAVPALEPAASELEPAAVAPGAPAAEAAVRTGSDPALAVPVAVVTLESAPVIVSAPRPVDTDPGSQPLRVAELRARWEALAEEIDEIPDDELDDRPTLSAAKPAGPPEPWDVDDGESGEIQVVELEAEAEAEVDAASRSSTEGGEVPVSEAEVVGELELAEPELAADAGMTQPMAVEEFEPATDDEVASAFEPPATRVTFAARAPSVAAAVPEPEPVSASEPVAEPDPDPGAEPDLVAEPVPVPGAVPADAEPASDPAVPAVIAIQETSSFVPIPESEVWPPPDLPAEATGPAYPPVAVAAPPPPEPAPWRAPEPTAIVDMDAAAPPPVEPPPALAPEPAPPAHVAPSAVAYVPSPPYVEPPDELPLREPTMILTDDPPPLAPAGPPPTMPTLAPTTSSLPLPAPPPSQPSLAAAGARPRTVTIPLPSPGATRPAPLPALPDLSDDDLPFADDFDVVEDADDGNAFADSFDRGGTGSDAGVVTPPPSPLPSVVVRVTEPPPAGGEFARELRRKMSAMAERLFRGDAPAVPFASGPGHDHHTEIDLRALDEEQPLPAAALTDDLGGATYVGDLPGAEPQAPVDRGTGEVGELRRGTADVPALVARMFAQTFTGKVVFRRGPVEKAIFFDAGRPVFATSSLFHDRMGELLHREGKITREQHDRCRDLVRDTGRRMGEILVERGYLKRRELLPAVRRHVEDIIYSLFAWDAGDYRVVAGDGAGNERIRLSRHAAAIILEGVRRKLDHDLLEQLLGPPGTVVAITDRDKLAAVTAVADLSREERAALAALDGVADLDQVARASAAGLETVYQLAWSLSLLGLVAPRRRADEDGETGALVGESDLRIDRERVRARSELCADADYFALLGVRKDATGFEIRRAYEAARKDFAPESFPPELRRELAADLDDIAVVLDEAFRVLRDDPLRSAYRGHLLDVADAG